MHDGQLRPWREIAEHLKQRCEAALIGITEFENAFVYSSKLEQKATPRPIYAADFELRELLRLFAVAATDLASQMPRIDVTYDVAAKAKATSASQAVEPNETRYINLDISGWSPNFKRSPHIRRVRMVADLSAPCLPRGLLAIAIARVTLIFRHGNFRETLMDEGSSVEGFPMGWSPSADSIIHAPLISRALAEAISSEAPGADDLRCAAVS